MSRPFHLQTAAATTSINNGLTPCEHGWLGWDCYFPQIDRNVAVFLNTDTETEKVADESVAWKYCGYVSVIDRINSAGKSILYFTICSTINPGTFDESCELIKNIARSQDKSIYIVTVMNPTILCT